ncbi:hypothetical protein MKZ38_008331 [Zalerion maritima]|uniref:Uncharacterized protein n=1 Tax=Zalerion maritima TaxID=339359 RepID=A0AAD5RHM1_9PEZI|nr:hypothetical protein MKZ38_008331 [Zalerion maritima]
MDQCDLTYTPGYHHWASTTSPPASRQMMRHHSPASTASPPMDYPGLPDQLHTVGGSSPYPCMPLSPSRAVSSRTSVTPTRSRGERQKMALSLAKRPYMRHQMSKLPSPPQMKAPYEQSMSPVGEVTGYELQRDQFLTTTTMAPSSPEVGPLPSPDVCPMGEGPFCACCQSSNAVDGVVRPQDLQYWAGRDKMDSQRKCHCAAPPVNRPPS